MSIFNSPYGTATKKDSPSFVNDPAPAPLRDAGPPLAADFTPTSVPPPRAAAPAPAAEPVAKESLIAADLTIESGAKLNGGVKAKKVIVAGELEGNIDQASRVELLESSALSGDVKAGTLTVAPGARIRGHVECGWDKEGKASAKDGKAANEAA